MPRLSAAGIPQLQVGEDVKQQVDRNYLPIFGLEEFSLLTEPLTAARARVQVSSPAKVFIILPGANLKSYERIIYPEAGE